MDIVVVQPEADQHAVEPERALEVGDDRDRAAAGNQQRVATPLVGQRGAGRLERRHAAVERDRRRAGVIDEFSRAILRQPRGDEGAERTPHRLRVLAIDQPERHLGGRLRSDHRLGAFADIAADNTVDVAGRPREHLLDQ
jgi:hypothetical protein